MTRPSAPDQEWWTAEEIAAASLPEMPGTKRRVNAMADRLNWRGQPDLVRRRSGRGGGWEYHWTLFPARAQMALLKAPARPLSETPLADRDSAWAWFDGQPEKVKVAARERLDCLKQVEALSVARGRQGAVADVSALRGVSARTIWNWLNAVDGVRTDDWLPHLAPRHRVPARRTVQADIDPLFMDLLKSDYLRFAGPSFASCYRRATRLAAAQGVEVPPERTARRRFDVEVSEATCVLARKGIDALRRMYPAQVRDKSAMHAMEAVNADFTWPSLSKTPEPGALMIGDNVDNQSPSDSYSAIGDLAFRPLVARTTSGGVNLTAAQEAALPRGDMARGEPPVIGLTNGLKQWLNRRSLAEDDGRNLIAMSATQAGRTIGALSKVNVEDAVNRYGVVIDGVAKARALAGSETCRVPMLAFIQGEYDYANGFGSTNRTRVLYGAALNTLFDDLSGDIRTAASQSLPPLFMIYQTGAQYTVDSDAGGTRGLHVGMAQIDVALSRDDTVMFGPAYPYTDKGGHLDANGSRWMGCQMAKVAARVMDGEGWQPLRPIEVRRDGRLVDVHFHVPVAPLKWSRPYVASAPTDYPAKGFRVTSADGATAYDIASVSIVRGSVVRIECSAAVPANALVWYAPKAVFNGHGCLCDSDPSLASDRYEYVPERGMYSAANIPELVGKRYPLENWCVAFCLPATYSEF